MLELPARKHVLPMQSISEILMMRTENFINTEIMNLVIMY